MRKAPESKTLSEGISRVVTAPVEAGASHVVKRLVQDAAPIATKTITPATLRGSSLKDAFVLKEILDRPVGLR